MPNTIYIYGDIGESWWDDNGITDDSIRQALDSLTQEESLQVRINTLGGATHHGVAIFNLLKSYSAKQKALNKDFILETIVDGFAYSAGSVIMMAGDKRTMNPGTRAMIHNPWAMTSGDYRDMMKASEYLKAGRDSLADLYAEVTGKDKPTVEKLMDDETYLLPQEALQLGLITEVGTITSFSRKDPYEKNKATFQDLSKLGKGAYTKTMLLGKEVSEKTKASYPIERLIREARIDTL